MSIHERAVAQVCRLCTCSSGKSSQKSRANQDIIQLQEQQMIVSQQQKEMLGRLETISCHFAKMSDRLTTMSDQFSKIIRRGMDADQSKLMPYADLNAGVSSRYTSNAGEPMDEHVKHTMNSASVEEQVPDQAPASHETEAQYLLKWPNISDWFKGAGVQSTEYVSEALKASGTLRPYGSSRVRNGQILDPVAIDRRKGDTNEQTWKILSRACGALDFRKLLLRNRLILEELILMALLISHGIQCTNCTKATCVTCGYYTLFSTLDGSWRRPKSLLANTRQTFSLDSQTDISR